MKRLPIFVSGILSLSTILIADESSRYIEVTGKATIKAEVDELSWSVKIRGEGDSIESSSETLNTATAELGERIATLDLGPDTLRFSRTRSGRVYTRENNRQVFKGFYAERQATVFTSDVESSQAIEAALLSDDRVSIENLELSSSEFEALKKQAIANAVLAAQEKAQLMAEQLGAELGDIQIIREGIQTYQTIVTENRIAMPAFASGQSASFEKLSFSSTVTLRFGLN